MCSIQPIPAREFGQVSKGFEYLLGMFYRSVRPLRVYNTSVLRLLEA